MNKIYLQAALVIVFFCSVFNPQFTLGQSASFTASADTVCQGSCITFTNTSTGSIDSLKWFINGITITNPDSNIITACFSAAGSDTVRLYVFDTGVVDTATLVVVINPVPSPVMGMGFFCANDPGYTTTLTDATPGGKWSSSDTTIEVVDSDGIVTNGSMGFVLYDSAYIMYTLPTGCFVSKKVYDESCESVPAVAKRTEQISIFPNPAKTELTITAINKISSVVISNILGQRLYPALSHGEDDMVKVNIAALPPGVYVVTVMDDKGKQVVERFVKE